MESNTCGTASGWRSAGSSGRCGSLVRVNRADHSCAGHKCGYRRQSLAGRELITASPNHLITQSPHHGANHLPEGPRAAIRVEGAPHAALPCRLAAILRPRGARRAATAAPRQRDAGSLVVDGALAIFYSRRVLQRRGPAAQYCAATHTKCGPPVPVNGKPPSKFRPFRPFLHGRGGAGRPNGRFGGGASGDDARS